MASTYSFDIVSDFDHQEMVNAVDQTLRELRSRYDLKNTDSNVELQDNTITVSTDSEFTLETIQDILRTKATKRSLSPKIFEYGKVESASGNRVRQEITLKQGIDKELAKKISKSIRDNFKKTQASIQGDAVRVSSKSKDDLQEAMQLIKQEDYPIALQFTNYR
ncbi:MAG: YajQ family cyclic di-GMP-binding protein [Jaaginema sp. PMC 1079.18]|nr:YajQ family cyclic di-GMP-binding protein [Jaaginema sp. PMC 1080.18]MEC4852319.1 YajQ family cyclic di-GMP-binding protein [Jaaginema sp. PMC 1079.18]MEC4865347.1 YajQ family cyclic di-GMP-binding protein [Jaaginema sp. PMC 1078.18]